MVEENTWSKSGTSATYHRLALSLNDGGRQVSRSKNTDKRRFAGKWIMPDGREVDFRNQRRFKHRTLTLDEIMMSRWVYIHETPYKNRACGAEFWSKRPGSNGHGCACGRWSKTHTHRLERRIGVREIRHELELPRDQEEDRTTAVDAL